MLRRGKTIAVSNCNDRKLLKRLVKDDFAGETVTVSPARLFRSSSRRRRPGGRSRPTG
jgi:hypothetical protein